MAKLETCDGETNLLNWFKGEEESLKLTFQTLAGGRTSMSSCILPISVLLHWGPHLNWIMWIHYVHFDPQIKNYNYTLTKINSVSTSGPSQFLIFTDNSGFLKIRKNPFLRYRKNQYIRNKPELSVKIKNREGSDVETEFIFVRV